MLAQHQFLLAPIHYPVKTASEKEKQVFSDHPERLKKNHFYRFDLSTGQSFIGCFDAEQQEAFFRLANNQEFFPGLKEIRYFKKDVFNKPVLLSELVISANCSKEDADAYHHIFDSHSAWNFRGSTKVVMNNHPLGQVAEKILAPLRELEYAKQVRLKNLKTIKCVLSGGLEPLQPRRKENTNG